MDYVQFAPDYVGYKEMSPGRTRQPKTVRLFQLHARRLLKNVAEHTAKARVLFRALSMERTKLVMNCGKTESLDNCCGLANCNICSIGELVKELDESLKRLCSMSRDHEALEKGFRIFEKCCLEGKKDPTILVTSEGWTRSVSKILIETMRQTLEVYGTTGKFENQLGQSILANLDFVYENIDREKLANAKFQFEVLNENPEETQLSLIPVQDFFNDKELNYHMVSLSIDFKVGFGVKQVPKTAWNWDGTIQTAEDFMKNRSNKDVYFVRLPNGKDIDKQVQCESLFNKSDGCFYGSQPKSILANNANPHLHLVPCTFALGPRLIVD